MREVTGRGEALYRLDEAALAELAPDLIVTQALCAVCAVSYDDVRAVAARLPSAPAVISLDPETLGEVLDDLAALATACRRARARRRGCERALRGAAPAAVATRSPARRRPRVAALEWLDPPYVGGHWVPEMIELAGGRTSLGEPGAKSRAVTWEELAARAPEVAVVMPCGLYVDEAAEQARGRTRAARALGAERLVAVDAASSFSRPGAAAGRRRRAARPPAPPGAGRRAPRARLARARADGAPGAPAGGGRGGRAAAATLTAPSASSPQRLELHRAPSSRGARAKTIRSPASAPPTSPPRWPPTLIPETPKVKTRLMTTKKPICEASCSRPRWRATMKAAAIRPKIAPEAPTVSSFGLEQQGAERAAEQRDEVDGQEPRGADRRARAGCRGRRARTC